MPTETILGFIPQAEPLLEVPRQAHDDPPLHAGSDSNPDHHDSATRRADESSRVATNSRRKGVLSIDCAHQRHHPVLIYSGATTDDGLPNLPRSLLHRVTASSNARVPL